MRRPGGSGARHGAGRRRDGRSAWEPGKRDRRCGRPRGWRVNSIRSTDLTLRKQSTGRANQPRKAGAPGARGSFVLEREEHPLVLHLLAGEHGGVLAGADRDIACRTSRAGEREQGPEPHSAPALARAGSSPRGSENPLPARCPSTSAALPAPGKRAARPRRRWKDRRCKSSSFDSPTGCPPRKRAAVQQPRDSTPQTRLARRMPPPARSARSRFPGRASHRGYERSLRGLPPGNAASAAALTRRCSHG